MKQGIYHGTIEELLGKKAIIREGPHESLLGTGSVLLAQFDDHKTGRSYGWWAFRGSDFTLYPEPYIKLKK